MTAAKPKTPKSREKGRPGPLLDDDATLRCVDRVLRTQRMRLTVQHDDDGFLVTLVHKGRRFLGLHSSLTEAFRDAFDDAGTL